MEIDNKLLSQIAGGEPAFNSAFDAFKTVMILYTDYAGATTFIEATKVYGDIGRQLGEIIYNILHPHPLEPMVYFSEGLDH